LYANQYAGGLVGYHNGNEASRVGLITDCYSLAYVSVSNSSGHSGGLVGYNYFATVMNSYAAGGVAGSSCGALIGRSSSGTVSNSFWNSETSAQLSSYGGTGITRAEMKTLSTYTGAGWDFNDVWSISDQVSYPWLKGSQPSPFPGPNPLLIYTIQDLDNVRNLLHGHYMLMNNLDFNENASYAQIEGWEDLKTSMTSGVGFNPLGSSSLKFIGCFDGNGKTVRNLYVNRPTTGNIGLFGFIGGAGKIHDLGIENVKVTGTTFVGAMVGYNEGNIQRSYTTGLIYASQYGGGLVGYNNGNDASRVGLIINCYSLAYVSCTSGNGGGLIGYNYFAEIVNSYASGGVAGSSCGALVGTNYSGTVSNSFWNSETSAQLNSQGGTGITMSEMKTLATYSSAGWDFTNVWTINDQVSYPWLQGSQPLPPPGPNPFPIYTIQDLDNIRNLLHGHYKLMKDLDFNDDASYAQFEGWEDFKLSVTTGLGFQPVGTSTSKFTGFFNGNGKAIKNLYINRPSNSYTGLIGFIGGAGWVSDLGINQGNILSFNYVGLISGACQGRILKSYAAGLVQANLYVGGIAGQLDGNGFPGLIQNSYTLANVAGAQRVGGAVGWSYYGNISNCYSTGGVTGSSSIGGLVGYTNSGIVNNSFWNIETSGQISSIGGTGIITEEMMQAATFTNVAWDFADIWSIIENETYPWLKSNIQLPYPGMVPVEIHTIQDLNNIRNLLHGHYILMNDLDFNEDNSYAQTEGWEALKTSFTSGSGFPPIGTSTNKFTGFFNGNGHKITNLFINLPATDFVGLFGYYRSASSIRDLGLHDVNLTGRNNVGAITGQNEGTILRCYASGIIKGADYVGGLSGTLNGNNTPGGFIKDSYSFVYVEGNQRIGGLAGWNYFGLITNSYAVGGVIGASGTGGLVGYTNSAEVLNSFWNTESTGQSLSAEGGSGATTWQMMMKSTFQNAGWDFNNTWSITENQTYPWLNQNAQVPHPGPNPSEIWTIQDLDNVRNLLHGHYKLMTDLDFDNDASYAQVEGWQNYKTLLTSGEGFAPIGNAAKKFTGLFEGNGHKITNLYINRPTTDYIGLFGYSLGSGNIRNLGLINVNITGKGFTGSLVGKHSSAIFSCYSSGTVQGTDYTGGFVGAFDGNVVSGGIIDNCYSNVGTTGTNRVGGLVGWNYYGIIRNSYSIGSVAAPTSAGGLIGYQNLATVNNCFWNIQTSGQSISAGGTGKTTSEMTYPLSTNTYSDWNFLNIWAHDAELTANNGYPFLGFPSVYESPDVIIPTGGSECFESEKVVTLAGGGTMIQVASEASLEVTALQSVIMLDGMVIKPGAYFHAWISSESGYCTNSRSLLAEAENEMVMPQYDALNNLMSCRIYPNPTKGQFTLEFLDVTESSTIKVEILSLIGESVMDVELPEMKQYLFDLSSRQPGAYLIRVRKGNEVGVKKVIRK
jgi:hypothetical protein